MKNTPVKNTTTKSKDVVKPVKTPKAKAVPKTPSVVSKAPAKVKVAKPEITKALDKIKPAEKVVTKPTAKKVTKVADKPKSRLVSTDKLMKGMSDAIAKAL